MTNIEQKYVGAARDLALDLLNMKAQLIMASDDLRKIVACDDAAVSSEHADIIAKLCKDVLSVLKERVATMEQLRLLNDIANGKLTVTATDGSEVRVTFDK